MSKRILVVEDQEDNRQIIRDMLTFTDYEITEAESGERFQRVPPQPAIPQRDFLCRPRTATESLTYRPIVDLFPSR
jgi:CheY-like chemotaxis protein